MTNTLRICLLCAALAGSAMADRGVDVHEYGGRNTVGVAVGGGGLVGVPYRLYMNEKVALELATFFRPIIDVTGGNSGAGLMLAGGFDFFFNKRYVARKNKIRSNGMFVKAGYSVSMLHEVMLATGWAHEMFHERSKSYSFNFELGPGVIFNNPDRSDIAVQSVQFALYWKLHWGWALKTGF